MTTHTNIAGEPHAEEHDPASIATTGMWVFLASEVLFFGGIFTGYSYYRAVYFDAFLEGSSHLSAFWGTLNTAILLTSSFTMMLSVHNAERGLAKPTRRFLSATIILGLAFLGIKFYEYYEKFSHHLFPGRNFAAEEFNHQHTEMFFSFYFSMTAIHALHMMIGLGLLSYFLVKAKSELFADRLGRRLEVMGLYWHFVDIIWIFLFPLLYLIGRHS